MKLLTCHIRKIFNLDKHSFISVKKEPSHFTELFYCSYCLTISTNVHILSRVFNVPQNAKKNLNFNYFTYYCYYLTISDEKRLPKNLRRIMCINKKGNN